MPFISVTRLRLRSFRYLLPFATMATQTRAQLTKAPGFQDGSLLMDGLWTFWTLTAWDSQGSMRGYMTNGAHKAAMPRLIAWCDEASVVHWDQTEASLPSWAEADRRMRATGRPSKVRHPTQAHATMTYRPPRTKGAAPIRPAAPDLPSPT